MSTWGRWLPAVGRRRGLDVGKRVLQVGFAEKPSLRWRSARRRVMRECSRDHHPRKGRNGSRIGLQCRFDEGLSQPHGKL